MTVAALSGLDARFLYSETANAHMHTLKVAVLDTASMTIDPEALLPALERRVQLLEPLLRRPVPVPFGFGHPVWAADGDFDIRRHVTFCHLDEPGDERGLAAVVAAIASIPLPRDRPLWEVTFVTGLAGGRLAAVAKVHHSVADGAATVELLRRALDESASSPDKTVPGPPASPDPDEIARVSARARRSRARMLPRVAAASIRNTAATALEWWRAPLRPAKPFDGPRTSLNVALSAQRTFAMTRLPLEPLLALRDQLGGTLNDAYLTLCTSALRAYLSARGDRVDRPLVASVPIGTRDQEPHRFSGNHVDNMYVRLPLQVTDPITCFRVVHDDVLAARALRDAMDPDVVAARAELTPAHLYPLVLRAWAASRAVDHLRPPVNVIVSNVAGPREPLHLGGAVLEAIYSVGPVLEGIGCNLTAWSYAGGLHVAALGSSRSLPDPWALVDRLPEAFDELVTAAGIRRSAEDEARRPA